MPGSRSPVDHWTAVHDYRLTVEDALQADLQEIKERLAGGEDSRSLFTDENSEREAALQAHFHAALDLVAGAKPGAVSAAAAALMALHAVQWQSRDLLRSVCIWRLDIPLVFRTDLRILLKKIVQQMHPEATELPTETSDAAAGVPADMKDVSHQIDHIRDKIFASDLPLANKLQLDQALCQFSGLVERLHIAQQWRHLAGHD